MNLVNKFVVILKLSRLVQWPLFAVIYLAAFSLTKLPYSPIVIIQAITLTFPIQIFLNGFNDIYDFETDSKNARKKFWFMGGVLEKKDQKLARYASIFSGLVIIIVSFFTYNFFNIFYISIGLLFGYIYSVPPLRLKERPILSMLPYPIGLLSMIGSGYSFLAPIPPNFALLTCLCSIGFASFAFVIDHESDQNSGQLTISTKHGKRPALLVSLFFFLLLFISRVYESKVINYYLIVLIIGILISIIKPTQKILYTVVTLIFCGTILIVSAKILNLF